MIRSYKGITPTIPATCYVDDSAQIIGDVVLGGMGGFVGGFVYESFVALETGMWGGAVAAMIGAGVLIMGARMFTAERRT